MARTLLLAALWLCATQHVQAAPPRRHARQVGLFGGMDGSAQTVTHHETKMFSNSVGHGPYTATVHATPFMSSAGLGAETALGGMHSFQGMQGGMLGGMLGGVPGFHAPMTAASHLLSGGFGALGHQMGGLTSGGGLLGGFSGLTSGLTGLMPGGMSTVSHSVHYGSSADAGLAAAEHQHLSSTAHQHSLLASQALAAANAVEDAQLQASLARRHLLHKAMAHQNYAHQAQMAAHHAHQRLLQAHAAQTAMTTSMYHNGLGGLGQYGAMGAYPGMYGGGYHAGMAPFAGGVGYGMTGAAGMGFAEHPLHSIIRKQCTSVHYINGAGGPVGAPFGMANGGLGFGGVALGPGMLPGQALGVHGFNGAYGSNPLFGGAASMLHGGLGMHGGYGVGGLYHGGAQYGLGGLYHGGLHSGLGYGAAGLHGGLGYGAAGLYHGLHGGLGYGAAGLYHGLHGGLGQGVAGLYHGLHGGLGYAASGLHAGLGYAASGLHGGLGYAASGLYHGLHGGLGQGVAGLYHGLHGGLGYGASGLYNGMHGLHSGLGYGVGGMYHGLHGGLGHAAYGLHSGMGLAGGSLGYGAGGLFGAQHPLHAAVHSVVSPVTSGFSSFGYSGMGGPLQQSLIRR